jgi:hypothetical protein
MADKSVIRSVRWSESFDNLVEQYSHQNERTRNWIIKKAVATMLGMAHTVSNSPEEDKDE